MLYFYTIQIEYINNYFDYDALFLVRNVSNKPYFVSIGLAHTENFVYMPTFKHKLSVSHAKA